MTENTAAKQKKTYLLCLCGCVVFMGLLHVFFKARVNDDDFFTGITAGFNTVWEWLAWRYATDSSRVLSEGLLYILLRLPFFVWCMLDVAVCALLFHSLCVMLAPQAPREKTLFVLACFLSYPFMHMASAGWIATTTNYLWPFAAACYALSGVFRRCRGEAVKAWQYIFYILCLFYAAGCEMSAAYTLLIFAGALLARLTILKKKDAAEEKPAAFPVYEFAGLLIAVAGLVFAFTCPGNAERSTMELQWMPEFPELSFLDKFRLCSVFVFEHFVAVPNVLFLIFALRIFFLKGKSRVIAALPLIIDLGFSAYYFVKRFILGGLRAYDFDFLTAKPEGAELAWQYAELFVLLLFIAAVLITILASALPPVKKWICVWATGSGFAVREALMLSPTMFSSWHRTLIFFYFGLIATIVLAEPAPAKDAETAARRDKLCRALYLLLFIGGIAVNLILTVGHELRR